MIGADSVHRIAPTLAPRRDQKAYWARNLRLLAVLLAVWAMVAFGFSILFVDLLDAIRIPGTGFRLGFWFAQQGSIYVFVVLIFVYAQRMNALDREFGVEEDDLPSADDEPE